MGKLFPQRQAVIKQGQALFPRPLCPVLGYFYSHCLNSAFFESWGGENGRLETLTFSAWSMVKQAVPSLPVQPPAPNSVHSQELQ